MSVGNEPLLQTHNKTRPGWLFPTATDQLTSLLASYVGVWFPI
jgi:hypothetical protein